MPSPSVASARSSRRNQGSIIVASLDALELDPALEGLVARRSKRSERRASRAARAARPSTPGSAGSSSSSRERIALAKDSRKVRPIAIASPTDFMWVVSSALGAGELLEGEARDLGDDVVDRRLEGRRRRPRDVVGDLLERVADRELRGHLRDREAGRLRGERRGARDARVHLDHDDLAGLGVDRELDVGAAGLDADRADHLDRLVAQLLIEGVGQRLRRRDRDRVAGVDAHRVDVLDRADDHDVVVAVAHHLELELAPAEHRLLDQHLVDRARGEALGDDLGAARSRCCRRRRPWPPSVKAGRTITGSAISPSASALLGLADGGRRSATTGTRRPAPSIVSRKASRSSARWIAS